MELIKVNDVLLIEMNGFGKDNDLVLIQKSIQCGYYRSRVTIQHEICEASVSRVSLCGSQVGSETNLFPS